jgi:murein biosynthesis integral membrane protein MurJ
MTMIKKLLHYLSSRPILRSSIIVALITLLAKVLGYCEKIVLAFYYGTSYESDVYNTVIAIILSVFIFFREIVEPGFLNVFVKALKSNDERGAWKLFNKFSFDIVLATVSFSVVVYLFPGYIIDLFAPGFQAEKRELAIRLIQISFPATVFLSLSSLTNITLNGLKMFALPTFGDFAFKLVILVSLVALFQTFGIYAVAIGILCGAIVKLLIHYSYLSGKVSWQWPAANRTYVKNAWQLTWPLLIGVSFSQIASLVDNVFASYLREGTISALGYARKIVELPVILFPYILSVVIFPYFSELAISKDKIKQSRLLQQSLGIITLVFLPLGGFFSMFSREIVEIIFQRGAFDTYSTLLTYKPLALYSLGMIFFAIETVLVVFYFSNADTRTPIAIGVICVIENILLTYFLINTIGYIGIPIALVISKGTKVIVLLSLLKKIVSFDLVAVQLFSLKVVSASVVTLVICYLVNTVFPIASDFGLIQKAALLIMTFAFGSLTYVLSLSVMKFKWQLLYYAPQ